jgi:hypothetical protein
MSVVLGGGVRAKVGALSLNFVPQIWHAQNQPFVVLPAGDPARSPFSSPWHFGVTSADLPLRFGYAPLTAFDLGESALWVTTHGFAAGLATESQWWGPGLRNAILMSNNAGGIPHAFVRTAVPIRTRAGEVEGRWIIGGLTESRFFDRDHNNDLRSLSGAVVTLTPALERHLTLGVARVVFAAIGGPGALPARSFDVFARWGQGSNVRAATGGRAAEQMTALFGRWIFPNTGLEAYAEWSRIVLPPSIRSLLLAPQFTQGFTVGWQYVTPRLVGPRLRLHLELTNLEQSPTSRFTDTLTYYVSRAVPQGYTQRGQVIGAAIGPGASSQWLAFDRISDNWSAGVFAGRIRWEQDTYYLQPTSVVYLSHDVTMYSGLRGSWRYGAHELTADLSVQRRYNYLFQNSLAGYAIDTAFDQQNVTLRFRAF